VIHDFIHWYFYRRYEVKVDYLPVSLDIRNNWCLIVGGGEVAFRKLKMLLKAGALVELMSPEFSEDIISLSQKTDFFGKIKLSANNYSTENDKELLSGYKLVIAATDSPLINRAVSVSAEKNNVIVNVVDNLELSSMIMPAIIDRSPLVVSVSTSGVAPILARKIRERIEWLLPTNLGGLIKRLQKLRNSAKNNKLSLIQKKSFYEWFLEKYFDENLNEKNKPLANKDIVERDLYDQFVDSEIRIDSQVKGKVYLVGAGPGDPELMTVKALKILQKADVVLYDSLISDEILSQIRRDAKLVHVGKRAKRHIMSQLQINQCLVDYAQSESIVVRLKGGDPFIFGRGGEELQVLARLGIPYEVVPGITAAAGCASYAGIPLTHRDHTQSIRFITGHQQSNGKELDWYSLAKDKQTLVFYMGLTSHQVIIENLLKHGLSKNMPVAVIENGTLINQRVIIGELRELHQLIKQHKVKSPSLIIVGEVAALSKELAWFQNNHQVSGASNFRSYQNSFY